jgi:SAM-dependent methyltransferase
MKVAETPHRRLGQAVVDLLEPRPGEHILDLGCGDGVLTQELAQTGAVVTGVDSSSELVYAARNRGLDIRLMDATALDFDQTFDAVFSNAALHWMRPPQAVIAGVARALRPGGRFVAELGGFGNVAAIRVALHTQLNHRGLDAVSLDPWYFPTLEDYARRLKAGGFLVRDIELIPRPTPLPTDMRGWLETFAESFTRALPADRRDRRFAISREAGSPIMYGCASTPPLQADDAWNDPKGIPPGSRTQSLPQGSQIGWIGAAHPSTPASGSILGGKGLPPYASPRYTQDSNRGASVGGLCKMTKPVAHRLSGACQP